MRAGRATFNDHALARLEGGSKMTIYLRIGFGAAAVTLGGLFACQMATPDEVVTSGPSPNRSAATTPAPESSLGLYSPENLRRTIATEIGPLESQTLDDTKAGVAAIAFSPVGTGFDVIPPGFVDALTTSLNSTEAGGYISWGALFETSPDAEHAFDLLVADHESADRRGLEPAADPNLGTESVLYIGGAYGWDTATIYLWRSENLVLAAVGVGDYDVASVLDIATGMQFRALNW